MIITRKTIEAIIRFFLNIFFICFHGPIRNPVLQRGYKYKPDILSFCTFHSFPYLNKPRMFPNEYKTANLVGWKKKKLDCIRVECANVLT